MDLTDLVKAVTEIGALGILAIAVLWLAPKASARASKSRDMAVKQHAEDINRICAVFQETTAQSHAMYQKQANYEREQCSKQFGTLLEKFEDCHRENLRAIEMLARSR